MNVRPLTLDDADAVARMAAADERALERSVHIGPADVREWWSRTDLATDSWLFEDGGSHAAAGWLFAWGGKGVFTGVVAQGWKGRGLGAAIAERAESRARERNLTRVQTFVMPEDEAAAALFRGRGYDEVRRFYDMAILLDAEPPEPRVPDGLVLDGFRISDARRFHDAIGEAFQDHWEWHGGPFDEWWEMRKDDDHSLWWVVRDGDEIVAAIRNEEGRYGGGYVGILGVRRAWRGRGLAKALLHRTFGEFWRRGKTRVTLGVDAESPTGATKLYESVGMSIEKSTVVYER